MRISFFWCLAAVAALIGESVMSKGLELEEIGSLPEAQVVERLPESHPTVLYAFAGRLFSAGRRDEAVMWFYAGQLRYRCHLVANPGLKPDGEPAVMASLNATLGQTINEWAGGSPEGWARAIDQALAWDEKFPDATTPKDRHAAARRQVRTGLAQMRDQIRREAASIRAQRASNGLENR